jgi:nucleotide-binding universal stress UspA family protein
VGTGIYMVILKMNSLNRLLLASHGTEGAQAAERMVFQLCSKGSRIHHLVVVPDLWKGMTGDDWLNNGSTRDRFRRYVESELEGEVREHLARMQDGATSRDIKYSSEVIVGKPAECLVEVSQKTDYDLVVMGSPRPKGKSGLRSRMKTELLTKALSTPLLIVPYPHD